MYGRNHLSSACGGAPFPAGSKHFALIVLLLPGLLAGCERAANGPEDAAGGAAGAAKDISGRYDVSGTTTTPGTGDKRKISGTVVLSRQGDEYTASFEFETLFPGVDRPVEAHVIGVGNGRIEGDKLIGTAQTQVVASTVQGVDPGFAFIPRGVTTRIVSESVGLISPDGAITVEIVSRAAEGESYAATRTSLSGTRVGDLTPPVAEPSDD